MDERVVWSDEGRWMKGLMKVLSVGLAILKEWGMIGLLKGYIWECLGSCLVGQLQKRKVRKGYLKVSQFLAYGTTLIADTSGKINSLERFARGDY